MRAQLSDLFPPSDVPASELAGIRAFLDSSPNEAELFLREKLDGFLYARQVTCPHCGGEAPLLNTLWLSKEVDDPWGVRIVADGAKKSGKVRFETYRVVKGRGPNGDNPETSTVSDGVGVCVHCKQAIDGDEIKAQARGESPAGKWQDRLYAVVAVRLQPKLDRRGQPQRYKTGDRAGEINTEKVRYFRAPNERDSAALAEAEKRLTKKWPAWEAAGVIPTEAIPEQSNYNRGHRLYGMTRWCDLFTPRQLLGHLTLIDRLNALKPKILSELGKERGRAVATYLQFAIDKSLDYNSNQTQWHAGRCVIAHTFTRHNFSLQWCFAEMILSGPNSGFSWSLFQVLDSYQSLTTLMKPVLAATDGKPPLHILNGSAACMKEVLDNSVDLICMDPAYYDNVQYAELSDYFYVWQRRTLGDLYPELFSRRLTNKTDEAVANPARDGSREKAKVAYERMMGEIFRECRRVLNDDGIMTVMFTHKSQEAWEVLTRSLIAAGWSITGTFPIESEGEHSTHQKDLAAAASSIFISCRKRSLERALPSMWTGLGGHGVAPRIREAVRQALQDFEPLKLNPVDRMVASYGRALQVLSEAWPVMDGNEQVGPLRAINEASRVVTEQEISRITRGRLTVQDLDAETAMALTLFGIYRLNEFPYDEALNLSRSLNIELAGRPAGYRAEGRMIGINQAQTGRARRHEEETGFHAPLVRKGSKLRLARPEERNPRRIENPQTAWDILHGVLLRFREGDIPVARAYLENNAATRMAQIIDLLTVWAAEIGETKMRQEADALLFGLRAGEAVAA